MKDESFLEQMGVLEGKETGLSTDERDPVDVKILSDGSHLLIYKDGNTEHIKW